jgi:DMSO reductase anchor subunit
MEKMNLHKQRIYSLIIAGVALVTLLLPWLSVNVYGYSRSWNGMKGWGLLSLLGIGAVAAASFMGNKMQDYDANMKKVVLGGFGAIALGALLFFIRKNSLVGSGTGLNTGFGLWLCLAVGVIGVLFHLGLVKPPKAVDDKLNK